MTGPVTRTVTIPANELDSDATVQVTVLWECPYCGGPRGEVYQRTMFRRAGAADIDRWDNPCGHPDPYAGVRQEAGLQ